MAYYGNIYTKDIYITGSLDTEPEVIEYRDLKWQKKAQAKFAEAGRDSFIFKTTHPRGFTLIIYPYWMVDKTKKGWEYIIFMEGWEREWDSWEESNGEHHAASYMNAMSWAINEADDWKIDPDHPEFPTNK